MELQEFVNSVMAEGVTAEQVTAIAQKMIDATTKAAYTSIDTAIETTTGRKKQPGEKTIAIVAEIAQKYSGLEKDAQGYQAKIKELSEKTPDVESIRKEYEAKIAGYENSAKTEKLTRMLERAAYLLPVSDAFKDTFADVLEAKISKILPLVAEKDGKLVMTTADGTPQFDSKGKPVAATAYLVEQLTPFTVQTKPNADQAQRPGGQAGADFATMTVEQRANYAKTHGINPLTAEGQRELKKLLSSEK